MKKSKMLILFLCITLIFGLFLPKSVVFAVDGEVTKNYVVYDENNQVLFEKSDVEVGDNYIDKNYKLYEVTRLDKENLKGYAKFIKQIKKPKVNISPFPSPIDTQYRHIGLYCTHNDESYLPSEGYYSIYGKGGIHDIAKEIKRYFENAGVTVTFDESLHLPHDSGAYSRSQVTAKKLLNENNLDAIFDIHRDGVSRSIYAVNVNGEERSKVRIVVGKANPSKQVNEEFALILKAVADELYPWLFADIYYASGHYNQGLSPKSLLFEMGTYLIEKELVLKSVEPLVHVINTALFNTTVDNETGELNLGGTPTSESPLITDHLQDKLEKYESDNVKAMKNAIIFVSFILILLIVTEIVILIYEFFKHSAKNKK